jgi:predicted aspartyl protease
MYLAVLAQALAAIAVVTAATLQCLQYYRYWPSATNVSTALRVVHHSPSDTSLEVLYRLRPSGAPMPFLCDTGFSGPTLINTAALGARDADPDAWDAGDEATRDRMIGAEDRPLARKRVRKLLSRNGIDYRYSTVRMVSALSGTRAAHNPVCRVAFGTERGTVRRSDALVDYIPHTPCILTLDDMVSLRPCILDTAAGRLVTQGPIPPGTATPVQRHRLTGVITFAVDVGGVTLDLIADTGYGGAVAVNESVADKVLGSECDLLHATVRQVDVHSQSVCANVFLAPVAVHFRGRDDPVAVGASVPVYINESSVLGADGLIGMAVMERFAPIVVTASRWRWTPRILMQGSPSHTEWDAATLHLEAPLVTGAGGPSCTPKRSRPTDCHA